MPTSQIVEETVEGVRFAPRERVQQRTAEKEIVEVVKSEHSLKEIDRLAPPERVQRHTIERVVDSVLQHLKDIVEVVIVSSHKNTPNDRTSSNFEGY